MSGCWWQTISSVRKQPLSTDTAVGLYYAADVVQSLCKTSHVPLSKEPNIHFIELRLLEALAVPFIL